MAENSSAQDKTEDATAKRQLETRKKGQLPRSRELTTMSILLAAAISFSMMGSHMLEKFTNILHIGLDIDRQKLLDPEKVTELFTEAIMQGFYLILPFLIVMVIVAAVAPIALGGWSFSPEAIGFKFSKMNPMTGMKRMFSVNASVELLKALAKFVLVGTTGYLLLMHYAPQILALGDESIASAISHAGSILVRSFILLSASLLIVAAIDVPFQIWKHKKSIRMTKQEVRDEHKDIEGKPEVKQRVRQLQRQFSQSRMLENIADADVVITNPTHYSVALKYDAENMSEPIVVAKGVDLIAGHIRRIAEANNVPAFEAPPLARALYYSTEIDKPVPAGLYVAVAQILAYIYQLKTATGYAKQKPEKPTDIPVPPEFFQGRENKDN
ncbi:MAG: flagellar biosynthesis protein FlhB [Gammaproteobacteria bacterium]